ncbi:MAG: hypothetical protein ACRD1M_06865 [Terriglobales bacterium]
MSEDASGQPATPARREKVTPINRAPHPRHAAPAAGDVVLRLPPGAVADLQASDAECRVRRAEAREALALADAARMRAELADAYRAGLQMQLTTLLGLAPGTQWRWHADGRVELPAPLEPQVPPLPVA